MSMSSDKKNLAWTGASVMAVPLVLAGMVSVANGGRSVPPVASVMLAAAVAPVAAEAPPRDDEIDLGRSGPVTAAPIEVIERFERDFDAPSAYPPALAGAPQRHFIYYYDQPRELILNLEAVALLDEQGIGHPTILNWGIEALDAERVPLAGWAVGTTPGHVRSDQQVEELVAGIADAAAADYVAPVFFDDFGGPLVPSPFIVVGFHAGVGLVQAEQILAASGAGVIERTWESFPGMYRLRSPRRNGFAVMDDANALAQLPQVRFASPDMIFTGRADVIPNDTSFSSKWELHNTGQATNCGAAGTADADMDASEAWDLEQGDPGIRVVIIDSGYQFNHPDINHSGFGADFTGEGGGGAPVHPCDQHGMAVAGCVSAIINNNLGVVGVAPGCTVASARPFVPSPTGPIASCTGNWTSTASWTVDALNWAQNTASARVTNNSNGYGFTDAGIEAAYAATEAAGIVHFASAGNSGAGVIGYPASIAAVNAVAALDNNNNLAGFSQFGVGLFISAGGVDILSTDRTGGDGYVAGDYVCIDGTSFSSPNTAGVAALVLSFDPSLTANQVEAILAKTATDLGAGGYDTTFGWGHVNAEGALLNAGAGGNPVCPSGGNCFASHPFPGCADEDCCNTICLLDPFCCNTSWDSICANEALANCGQSCGHPDAGDCFINNGTPYCNDFECCEAVCAIDPFCCDTNWDTLCANEAIAICCPDLAIIDFEDLGVLPDTQLNPAAGVGVVTNGYNYDPGPNNDSGLDDLHISNKQAFFSWNNTTVGGTHDDVVLSRTDGGRFELKQFDFAGFPTGNEIAFSVTAQPSGQVVNFTPDGVVDGDPDGTGGLIDFQTFTPPPAFSGTSFTWEHFGPGTAQGLFALDNIFTCPTVLPPCPGARIDFGVTPDDFGNPNDCVAGVTTVTTQYAFTQDIVFGTAVDNFSPPAVEIRDDGACSPSCRSTGVPAYIGDWWCQFRLGAAAGQPGQPAGVTSFAAELCFIDALPGTLLMEGYNNDRSLIATAVNTQNGTEVVTIIAPPGELIAYVRVVSSDPNRGGGLSIDCLTYPNPVLRIPDDLVNFFSDPVEFDNVVNLSGKILKGNETFEEAVVGDGVCLGIDDPLDTTTDNGIFSPGDILFNLAFQSNLDAPGINGPNPRGINGMVACGPGAFGATNKAVAPNFFQDSHDILSLNPNHTAFSMILASGTAPATIQVLVFDKNDQIIGQVAVPATPEGVFVGFVVKNRESFGRINLLNVDGTGTEYLYEVAAYINVEEKCPWDCGDNNGVVDIVDLLALLSQWNGPGSCDFDVNGVVNIVDLLALLSAWGPCPVCPAPGNCFEPHGNPGCSLQDCCNSVCAVDPFCCDVVWDQICADEALAICNAVDCNDPASCQFSNLNNAFESDGVNGISADNFVLVDGGIVASLCWRGVYFDNSISQDCGPGPDDYRVRYYTDAAGIPGTLIAEFSQAGGSLAVSPPVATGDIVAGVATEYENSGSHAPIFLSPGVCYWVEVINTGLSGTCQYFWSLSSDGDFHSVTDFPPNGFGPEDVNATDFSFCLNQVIGGTPPCPQSAAPAPPTRGQRGLRGIIPGTGN